MIGEFILNIVFGIVEGLLALLPDMSWSIEVSKFSAFASVIRTVTYLLPMDTVTAILSIIIAITVFKVIISLIKTIWELLPIV